MSLDVYLYVLVDTGGAEPHRAELFSANITHNLSRMAAAAGIYECLWRPEEMLAPKDLVLVKRDAEAENFHSDNARSLREQVEAFGVEIYAEQLIEAMRAGLEKLMADPAHFKTLEPAPDPYTGEPWGQYKHFVPWVEKYLAACVEHPRARVEVSR